MKIIAEFDREIQQNPNDPKLYNSRGNAYAKGAVDDKAIADFNKAIQLDPNYMTAYYNRGIAYFNTGDSERAIADFNKAIQLNPNYADAYYTRGYLYLHRKKDFEKAIADFDKAVQNNPDYTEAYKRRAEIYRMKNDYDKAIANYDQAIRITPKDVEAYLYRGRAYSSRGNKQNNKEDFTRAIADFDEVIRIKPDYAEAYRDRGMAYGLYPGSDVARLNQSIADCEKALRLGLDDENRIPTEGFLKNIRGKLGAAQRLNEGTPGLIKSLEAATQFKEKETINDNAGAPGAEPLVKRGYLFLEDSDWNKADEYFEKALDINPEYAPAYIGKLCVELKVNREVSLGDFEKLRHIKKFDRPLGEFGHFQKALRFADASYKEKLIGYDNKIKDSFPKTIPQQFTDEFIKGEITRLESEISCCNYEITEKKSVISNAQSRVRNLNELKDMQRSTHFITGGKESELEYDRSYQSTLKSIADENNEANVAEQRIKENTNKKTKYEAKKKEMELEAGISCLDRMDLHYNHFVEAMKRVATRDEYKNYAEQFRLLKGYKDSAELADKCDKLANECVKREKKARYDALVKEKNNASSESIFKQLAQEFRNMGVYENAAQLANECDKLAEECGKREKKARYDDLVQAKNNASSEGKYKQLAQEFREIGDYENAAQLAVECDKLAEECGKREKKARYDELVKEKSNASSEEKYKHLASKFRGMGDYENAVQLANECDKKISEFKEQHEKQERRRESKEKILNAFPTIGLLLQFGIILAFFFVLYGTNVFSSIDWNKTIPPAVFIIPFIISLAFGFISLIFRKDVGTGFPWGASILILAYIVTIVTLFVWSGFSMAGSIISVLFPAVPLFFIFRFGVSDNWEIKEYILPIVLFIIPGGILSSIIGCISDYASRPGNFSMLFFILSVIPALPGMIMIGRVECSY